MAKKPAAAVAAKKKPVVRTIDERVTELEIDLRSLVKEIGSLLGEPFKSKAAAILEKHTAHLKV